MIVINPREVAVEVLVSVTKDKEYNNLALKRALKQNGAMDTKNKAFVTEVVNGTLRNIFYLDFVINHFSTLEVEKMKPWIGTVVRTAVYQMAFMNVPDSAAVDEAVKLVKKKGMGKLVGFTNGLLRNIAKGIDTVELPKEETNPAEFLSVKYSHPLWLVKMWLSKYDYDFVKDLCIANSLPPQVTIGVNLLKTTPEKLIAEFEKEGITATKCEFVETAFKISGFSDLTKMSVFKNGHFHVQDESSMLAAMALAPKKGEKVLDVCSAPGGKSLMSAQLMENEGEITSRDVVPHKLELIEESAKRLGIKVINTQLWDATKLKESDKQCFDKVLVDAPCTGFGLMGKKADIRINRTGNDIDNLCKLQKEILSTASEYVAPKGTLVYSTCTISKKENEGNLKWFLENFPFETEDLTEILPTNLECDTKKDGYVNLYPHIHHTDGFFIARLKRKEKQ
ncbi:MAG: 16S rRNA (cytosine(967)-C(5))-methyltransferase RsmB [Anaerotignaceae bacterium]